ncbi:SpoIIE family protein phosphatase [Kineococcus terrestris]|uniref:SpoIIE family protein phosphatase n=1 Tax=Kineococcus terrestris TaxID=2044856 RepID=UPI0034DB641B
MSAGEGVRAAREAPGAELLQLAAMAAGLGQMDLRRALRSVTDAGVSMTGAQYGAFFYSGEDAQGGRFDLYTVSGESAGAFPDRVPLRHTAMFSPTFSGAQVVRSPDVLRDPRYGANATAGLPAQHPGVRSYLAVPVTTPDARVIGAMLFAHREPGHFDEGAEIAARAVAAHAAAAVENARLLGQAHRARREAEDTAQRLQLLQDVTALLSTAASTAEIAARVPEALTDALGCTGAHLLLLDPDAGALAGVHSSVTPAGVHRTPVRLPLSASSPSTHAVLTAAPVSSSGAHLRAWPGLRGVEMPGVEAAHAVPLLDRARRPLGALTATWSDAAVLDTGVTDLLAAVAGQVAQALERTRLYDAQQEAQQRLTESVEALSTLARDLQSGLLPRRLPELERVRVAVGYLPAVAAAEVGGDWFDVVPGTGEHVTFVIGDVQGHNTTAAGLMGQLRTAVRAYVSEGHDPATALARTNSVLLQLDTGLFATCCLVRLDQGSGEVVTALAGHPPPLLLGPGGEVTELDAPAGTALGVTDDAVYEVGRCQLTGRSRLVLYTDGVVEAAPEGSDLGLATVAHVLRTHRDASCEELVSAVTAAIPHRLTDDAALLVLDYSGPRVQHAEAGTALAADLRAVAEARRFLLRTLRSWGVDEDVTAGAELVVSELVTNAVTHTGSPPHLHLSHLGDTGHLRVAVSDGSTRHPAARAAGPDALGGRGLAIVEALAERWGVSDQGEGKVVWARLALP